MKNPKFAACINCIDGRVQEPVIAFLKKWFNVDYIDLITEPGPDALLAEGKNKLIISSIKKRVKISVEKHNSKIVAIAGHYDCAANPVNKNQHIAQIKGAVERIESWDFGVSVFGIWINRKFIPKIIVSRGVPRHCFKGFRS